MRGKSLISMAVVVGSMLALPSAQADPGAATHIDALSATVGSQVVVTGGATFVDVPVKVIDDPDAARVPQIGANVTEATFSRPVGTTSSNSTFNVTFTIGDPNPVLPNGSYPGMVYLLPLMVGVEDTGLFLMAGSSDGGNTTPALAVMRDGADGFTTVSKVNGSLGNGKLVWKIPLSTIGAPKPGAAISQGGAASAEVRTGMTEVVYCCTTADWFEQYTVDTEYFLPGATVNLGIAPAGTPIGQVALTKAATIPNWSNGAFSGALAKPDTPGDYIVVAEACYTGSDCVRSSTPLTVA